MLNVEAHFNRNGIANILSLDELSKKYRITIDTEKLEYITVHINVSIGINQCKCGIGIYYYDTAGDMKEVLTESNYTFVSTVKDNNKYFSEKEIIAVYTARKLQTKIRRSSSNDIKII